MSLQRAALGLAFGGAAAVLLALLAGLSRLGEALIDGTAQLFGRCRSSPSSRWPSCGSASARR
ncbi:hypothetical protein [Kitasatospora fiedleri]|uniref:hypothetical protein n=1 Tax=Kitasatospora fiedleri TaxID=2991545 RepID=UPI002989AD83|nr:hypothetical protein [Kitasatospora fiedleri]